MSSAQRFVLDVPDAWKEVDLSGGAMAAARSKALAMTGDPVARARLNDMFRQGRDLLRSARNHGALLSTGTVTQYDDGVFMAYAMVFAVSTPDGVELTLPLIAAQMGVASANGKAPRDREVTSVRIPEVGTVARVTGTETTRVTADVDVQLLTMYTILPVPGRARDYLVVVCASPNLPLRETVYDLFDAITGTFRFVSRDGKVLGAVR
ncbi:hypothetical protein GCM10018793_70530 [Streptomyces sulfonofaciens]|uniref:Uncharacterized protein n=1 Tax=Streptomyces sulfonofaciens TaxID=68272 RepID=A0A919GRD4_9ACTN|nr:hypothetical protein [Streptomyces sulfonofaciens]GHH88964.1 hypothetical protein GCM10018793_70530 [Streptomyces sulfonofaciens]